MRWEGWISLMKKRVVPGVHVEVSWQGVKIRVPEGRWGDPPDPVVLPEASTVLHFVGEAEWRWGEGTISIPVPVMRRPVLVVVVVMPGGTVRRAMGGRATRGPPVTARLVTRPLTLLGCLFLFFLPLSCQVNIY